MFDHLKNYSQSSPSVFLLANTEMHGLSTNINQQCEAHSQV